MAPYKKCPQCHTKLHIRLWACSCGYTFAIKRSKPVSPQKLSKKTEMRFIRKNEREVVSELHRGFSTFVLSLTTSVIQQLIIDGGNYILYVDILRGTKFEL